MSLTFGQLQSINRSRCIESFHELDSWNTLEWMGAVAGEVGEACNIAKKIRRLQTSKGYRAEELANIHQLTTELGHEIADSVIYLDLVATSLGFNLQDLIREKFNITSDRLKSTRKL